MEHRRQRPFLPERRWIALAHETGAAHWEQGAELPPRRARDRHRYSLGLNRREQVLAYLVVPPLEARYEARLRQVRPAQDIFPAEYRRSLPPLHTILCAQLPRAILDRRSALLPLLYRMNRDTSEPSWLANQ